MPEPQFFWPLHFPRKHCAISTFKMRRFKTSNFSEPLLFAVLLEIRIYLYTSKDSMQQTEQCSPHGVLKLTGTTFPRINLFAFKLKSKMNSAISTAVTGA